MPISFSCKSCGKPLRVKDSLAGRAARCPDCGNRIRIPDDRRGTPGATHAAAAESDFDDDYEEFADDHSPYTSESGRRARSRPQGRDENPYATPSARRDVQCPACGESISQSASRCRYCGERFGGHGSGYHSPDESLQVSDWVLAIICPCVGCVVGIIYLCLGRRKGLTLIGVSLLIVLILGAFRALFLAAVFM